MYDAQDHLNSFLASEQYLIISDYKKFLQDHCRKRGYILQVRQCNNMNCCTPRRSTVNFPWVPDPVVNETDMQHFKDFDILLGTETTEKDKPSSVNVRPSVVAEQMQVLFFSKQNVDKDLSTQFLQFMP